MPSFSDDETVPWAAQSQGGRLVVQVIGPHSAGSTPVTQASLTIGRSEEADVRVDDPALSRLHVKLDFGDKVLVTELGSRNGSRLGGTPLVPHTTQELALGQPLSCGASTLVVQPAPSVLVTASDYAAALAQGGFRLLHLEFPPEAAAEFENTLGELLEPHDLVCEIQPGQFELALQSETIASAIDLQNALQFVLAQHRFSVTAAQRSVIEPGLRRTGALVVSRKLRDVYAQASRVAGSSLPVLVTGETGVGKEILARTIHQNSSRRDAPFVALNCGGLSPTLLESELFGHERGAFTGAVETKVGLFEAAGGGTLFLDELGEMPADTQVKLLRVLEDGRVRRVGGVNEIPVDVRIISATNRDLKQDVDVEKFREDLYYRLEGFRLHIPPLRERPSDILALARFFIAEAAEADAVAAPRLSAAAATEVQRRPWRGNARELKNAMRRAIVLAETLIEVKHLPPLDASAKAVNAEESILPDEIDNLERSRILAALEAAGGNQSQAARDLGISRKTLMRRLDRYGVPRPRKGRSSPE